MRRRLLLVSLLAIGITTLAQQKPVSPELLKLADSERTFSRTSAAKGVRASFVEFFSDEAINFTPHPGNAQEYFRTHPAPAGPQPFTLTWEPIIADISQAGDLGYTTGPVLNVDNANKRPPRYSYYFSVWKKQPDNNWKVLIDLGTGTPTPTDPTKKNVFVPATPGTWRSKQKIDLEVERAQLLEVERKLSSATQQGNVGEALNEYLADEARLHRDGFMPMVTKKKILAYFDQQQVTRLSYLPIAAGVSKSADIGYSYGKYELTRKDKPVEKGYIVRVWKRNKSGVWKLVADIANALPTDEK